MSCLLDRYQQAIKDKLLKPDVGQMHAITYLNNLQKALNIKCQQKLPSVYIYGPVGRGKSMIMDLFCKDLKIMYRRVHFHAFMEELHHKMHSAKKENGDPVAQIAREIGCEARVLCFDEFYITNIADAMLLGRLFEKLFAENILVIATSNWAVEDLFQGGVNRAQFMPFIRLMKRSMDMIELNGGLDYRSEGVSTLPYYLFSDHYKNTEIELQRWFEKFSLVGDTLPQLPEHLKPKKLAPRIAWYSFEYLCGQAMGREDYLDLSEKVDTVILENVPLFSASEADAALRFVTLIDILYENKVRFICSAADVPHALCKEGDAADSFVRTASRISEMQKW